MKRPKSKSAMAQRRGADEMLAEYDFSRARRNKYASRYAKGTLVVSLAADVAALFPGAREVNGALRALAGLGRRASSTAQGRGRGQGIR